MKGLFDGRPFSGFRLVTGYATLEKDAKLTEWAMCKQRASAWNVREFMILFLVFRKRAWQTMTRLSRGDRYEALAQRYSKHIIWLSCACVHDNRGYCLAYVRRSLPVRVNSSSHLESLASYM